MSRRLAPFDTQTAFTDPVTSTTLTSSDVVQLAGADVILTLGPNRTDCSLIIEIDAIEIDTNNELYSFLLQLSDVNTFDSVLHNAVEAKFGATEVLTGGADDSVVGRYIFPFGTDYGGLETLTYARLNVIVAGTISTGISFRSWVSIPQLTS